MDIRKGTRLIDRPEFKSKPVPITFLKKDKVFQAIEIMSEKNYGSVVIVDNKEKVIGIVTERDIVKKLVKMNKAKTTLEFTYMQKVKQNAANNQLITIIKNLN